MNIGDTLTSITDLDPLPGGSVVSAYHTQYTKLSNGLFLYERQVITPSSILASGRTTVVSLGTDPVPDSINDPTPTQFTQRLFTVTRGSAYHHSVSVAPIHQALRGLGLTEPPLATGMWFHARDQDLQARFGAAPVVLALGNPNNYTLFMQAKGANATKQFGHLDVARQGAPLQVVDLANLDTGEAWGQATATDEDRAQVAALKVTVWAAGNAARDAAGWCSVFQQTMASLGMDAGTVRLIANQPALPDYRAYDEDEIRQFPVGTIFGYANNQPLTPYTGSWNWTYRPATGGMRGTEHLLGPNGGRWGGPVAVVHRGDEPMRIPLTHDALTNALPVGTVVTSMSGHTYTRGTDSWVHSGSGEIDTLPTARQVNPVNFITHIPGIPVVEPPLVTGSVVTRERRNQLPPGAVVVYPVEFTPAAPPPEWLFVRDGEFLMGTVPNLDGGRGMVLWDGTGDMAIPTRQVIMDAAPVGSRVAVPGNTTDVYEKEDSSMWRHTGNGERYNSGLFGTSFRFTHIPRSTT